MEKAIGCGSERSDTVHSSRSAEVHCHGCSWQTPRTAGPVAAEARPFPAPVADCAVEALGFEFDRVRGSHHIYRHAATGQRLNLQARGGQAKPYQLRQLLELVERHALRLEEER